MNSLSYAFVAAGIRTEESLPEVPEAPVRKLRSLVKRNLVFWGGRRLLEINTKGALWNHEFEMVFLGRHVRVEGAECGEFVNFTIPGFPQSRIGERLTCFFQIDQLTFDDESVFYEVVLRPTSFAQKVDTRVIVGPKKYFDSDIQLATGGYIAVLPLLKKV